MPTNKKQRGRLLIVEDDEDIQTDVAELLRDEGYDVVVAHHGADALRILRAGLVPSLILLDLMMPIMDGWQFRTEQLQDPVLARIPVVLFSGAGDVHKYAVDMNVAGYVSKPIKLEHLFRTVAAHDL